MTIQTATTPTINTLIDALPKMQSDSDQFRKAAARVLRGLVHYALENEPDERRNLSTIQGYLGLPQAKWNGLMTEMRELRGPAASAVSLLESVGQKERGSILSTAANQLFGYLDKQIKGQFEAFADARNAQLVKIGRALHGEDWIAPLARDLDVDLRTAQRWANGTHKVPPRVIDEQLPAICAAAVAIGAANQLEERARILRETAHRLECATS